MKDSLRDFFPSYFKAIYREHIYVYCICLGKKQTFPLLFVLLSVSVGGTFPAVARFQSSDFCLKKKKAIKMMLSQLEVHSECEFSLFRTETLTQSHPWFSDMPKTSSRIRSLESEDDIS